MTGSRGRVGKFWIVSNHGLTDDFGAASDLIAGVEPIREVRDTCMERTLIIGEHPQFREIATLDEIPLYTIVLDSNVGDMVWEEVVTVRHETGKIGCAVI